MGGTLDSLNDHLELNDPKNCYDIIEHSFCVYLFIEFETPDQMIAHKRFTQIFSCNVKEIVLQ